MFFHFVKYKLDTIKLKTKLFAGSKGGLFLLPFWNFLEFLFYMLNYRLLNSIELNMIVSNGI